MLRKKHQKSNDMFPYGFYLAKQSYQESCWTKTVFHGVENVKFSMTLKERFIFLNYESYLLVNGVDHESI